MPECITLDPENDCQDHAYWLPDTCAYRRLWAGQPLPEWHPLITGTAQSVHDAGVSMQHRTVPEFDIAEDDWEDHIIEEPV